MSDYPYWDSLLEPYDFGQPFDLGNVLTRGVAFIASKFWTPEQIRSASLALDPFSVFRPDVNNVALVNRYRSRMVVPAKSARYEIRTSISRNATTPLTPSPDNNPRNRMSPQWSAWSNTSTTSVKSSQEPLYEYCLDTAKSTRKDEETQGELEKLEFSVHSPSRSWQVTNQDLTQITTSPWIPMNLSATVNMRRRQFVGPSGRLTQAQINSLMNAENNNFDLQFGQKALFMLSKSLPQSRRLGLFRSLVELRDLPHTLKSIFDFRLSDLNAARTADAYLTAEFGIKPVIDDLLKLLKTPQKVSQRVNRLMSRRNQPTTFRFKTYWDEPIPNPPAFSYDAMQDELSPSTYTTATRRVTLRSAVNANVRLPNIAAPLLRTELYDRLIGALPRYQDFYKLYPWTWLFDWFTGLGDYLECIDLINTDDSLINYGFFTYLSEGKVTTAYRANATGLKRVTIDGIVTAEENIDSPINHSSVLSYTFQKRKSLGAANGVKLVQDVGSLSTSQQTILGALFTQALR